MSSHTNGHANGQSNGYSKKIENSSTTTLAEIQKSHNFTSRLPTDAQYPTPIDSHHAPRQKLGPRMVRSALFTYVRPEPSDEPELLAVSKAALRDIGLAESEATSEELKQVVAGNKFYWDEENPEEGIYPWAQCYGGFQFGSWAGQLGDGRALSLFETTNPQTGVRYEVQLKGAGKTPYSRFADGKAVLRSSIREFVVSEYLNAIGIPTTRALSLTLCPKSEVIRERLEPGAIVCRFAQSWIRFGTFDLLRSRGDRDLIRKVATYVAEDVFGGWEKLPAALPSPEDKKDAHLQPSRNVPKEELQGKEGAEENRFTRLYREITRRTALLVGKMQAYGFMNGVLNTDNTSIFGLSLDYGPFAFMDNFDPAYTPNHDDHMLRYSYRSQPSIFWWNLVRLGETFGELIGSGDKVDDEIFIEKGVEEDFAPILIKRAETIIDQVGDEYKAVFMSEYRRLMTARLGLKTQKESDFDKLFSELLDTMEALELDFNHFFRRLSSVKVSDIETKEGREKTAERFFHHGGVTGLNETNDSARVRIGAWLDQWRARIIEDWEVESPSSESSATADAEREKAMKSVNPNFVPRGWLLDDIIDRVQNKSEREILKGVMEMVERPFEDSWGWDEGVEEKYCGDVPSAKSSPESMPISNQEIHLVNVFTSSSGGGNLAPIVLNATGLSDDEMREIARQHQRESAFAFPAPKGEAVDYELRFFVPEHEMEMCGHATVGTAWVMRELGVSKRSGEGEMKFLTKSGVVRTRVEDGEERVFVSQPKGVVENVSDAALVEEILSVLGIDHESLGPWPVQNARTSRVKTMILLKDVDVLNNLKPTVARVKGLCEKLGSTGLYPHAVVQHSDSSGKPVEVEARQFPKASGYPEDAATGIAAAALVYALAHNGMVKVGAEVVVHQGRAMGRLSRITVKLEDDGCWVGGSCAWEGKKK
ncbi:hypothetical protein H2200_010843 [Cladophialophora chaetospira]|uniref:Selenoprotein O n=1 Tax=Cladophialophora chaetospira TaxID=386627 RepID=A0AA39CDZ2_9EURO|nr:hypothetical protein H2200_010843 [Cladophialophora chaetospira]